MERIKLKHTLLEEEGVLTCIGCRTLRCVFEVATLCRIIVDYCKIIVQANEFMFK